MAKKILVVDDDPVLTKLVETFLTNNGYEVVVASDGQIALDYLNKDPNYSLILLDVSMPNMNGYTFVFELARLKLPNEIPIIVLTAKDGMADIFKVEGVKEYIVKPCDTAYLLEKVKEFT